MKTILALWHVAQRGKTATIQAFANLILTTPGVRIIHSRPTPRPVVGDIRLVVDIGGVTVGIESHGDPDIPLRPRLIDLADNFNCDVIVCATRTRGESVWAVEHLETTRGFEAIWSSTYQMAAPTQYATVNNLKAVHMFDLLRSLGRI